MPSALRMRAKPFAAWTFMLLSSPCSGRVGRRADHVLEPVTFGDQSGVLEDVEGHLEGGARDLDVRGPAAEPLVGGSGGCQDCSVDAGEEGRLCLGDAGGRR